MRIINEIIAEQEINSSGKGKKNNVFLSHKLKWKKFYLDPVLNAIETSYFQGAQKELGEHKNKMDVLIGGSYMERGATERTFVPKELNRRL